MALIDKASLLMVPSTYEDGTLYNVLPSGNKAPDETGSHNGYDQTRADFTFSRGSNLAATRVNADGLIEKGRENLLLQSNQFDTTWYNSNSTETGGQADKDGGTDAWLLTKTSTNGGIRQNNTTTGVQTFSFYAKAADSNWVKVNNLGSSAYHQANFDLVNGVVGTTAYIIDAKIEDVGNGWFRCITTYNATLVNIDVRVADSDNVVSGTSGSIYIQNAQLEKGLVSTPYIATGSTTATAGVLENTPRIDYSSGAGALLLESQRTNLITQSEYFGSYTPLSATITDNVATSPEGVINAASFIETTASGRHRTQTNSFAVTSGSTYTLSMFAKIASGSRLLCLNADYLFNARAYFNLVSGSVEGIDSGSASIEDYGNGWYRCSITGTSSITGSSIAYFGLEDNASDNGYVGDGTSGHYWYGIQAETASYVSSYVPTYGSAATRGAENLFVESLANELTTGYTSATLMIEFKYKQDSVGDAFVWGQDNNTYPAGRGYLYNKQSGFADSFGGGGFNDMSEDTTLKLIYRLNTLSNADVFLNGTKGTNVSGTAWSAINQIRFRGAYYTFEISQIAMYSEALTDAECVTLTTL